MRFRSPCGVAVVFLGFLLGASADVADASAASDCRVVGEASAGAWTLDVVHDARHFRSVLRAADDPTRTATGSFDLATGTFSHVVANGTGANASRAEASWRVHSLHEYRDRDADGRFGPGDESVRQHRVASLPQPTLQVLGRVDGGYDALAIYPINASSGSDGLPMGQAPPLPGQLRVAFLMLEEPALVDGQWVPPTRVPITADIVAFPFVSNDTRLALEVRIEAHDGLARTGGGFAEVDGFARSEHQWGSCAAVDGSEYPNRLLLLEDAATTDPSVSALFNYPPADDVRQSFAVTAAWAAPPAPAAAIPLAPFLGDLALFAAGALVSCAIVAFTVLPRLRNP
ncbi:MAG: hypothetical protein HYT80_02650 [Euryarchaeota archaeon]|nr:hypothetical protein [Euryarchaeota archaeon]